MNFLTLSWKNLTRRPLRLALTAAGLAIAVAAVIALLGIAQGFERSFLQLYFRRGVDLVVQHGGGTMQLNRGIDARLEQKIKSLPGVRQVIAGLMDVVALEKFDLFAVIVNGWAPDCVVLEQETMLSGRRLAAGDRGQVMLGKVLAANTGKRVGDKLEIYGEPFEVIGVFDSFSVYETGAAFMLLEELQRLMDRPNQVTGFVVQSTRPGDTQAIASLRRDIEQLDANVTAVPVSEFVHNVSQIRVLRAGAWVTSAIAVTIGIVGVLNTMIMSVFERVREIGTLRAIGWRKRRIMAMVLCEAAMLSILGALAGAILATVAIQALGYWPKVAGFLEGGPPLIVLAEGCLVALVVGLVGAAYPAYWAASLLPVDALRRH